jgi:broad specificity phosphatase PhoE
VAAATERPVRLDPRFREIDVGALRIARPEDARKAISSMVTRKGPMVLDFSKHGGEGATAFGERVAAAVHDLVLAPHGASEERVAIVCHGGFINAALYAFLDLPFTGVARFGVGNCSITTVRVQGEARVITAVNDCAHLASLAGAGSPVVAPRDQITLGR